MKRLAMHLVLNLMLVVLFSGCASFRPIETEHPNWVARAQVAVDSGVTVRVAALTPDEARAAIGYRLDSAGIQPVWVEVVNHEPVRYYIPPITIDYDYFSPLETAWIGHGWFAADTNARIDAHLLSQRLPHFVDAGATVSGFVMTNLDEGVKYVNLELISEGTYQVRRFSVLAPIPGLKTDYEQVDWRSLFAQGESRNLDENGLREWLAQLICCTKGGDRSSAGDPVNIVIIGSPDTVFPTLARRGWRVTETTTASSTWQTIMSSLFGTRYRNSPISPLYLFDRQQDIALQKPRSNVNQRNHMRLWVAPVTVNGARVWVGQISRDIGVRLTSKTLTTHKIDPNVDEARWYLIQDLFFSQGLARLGWVKGVGVSTPEAPRRNYTGDPYHTDGLRAVLWMSEEPVTYQHIQTIPWESPPQ